ncbi:unnamed protein product [Diatraea saccharalis]|uniref:Glycogen debranching enzyme n=1 Tax=Diatraea saccharalis TaxID=40085 RepID=A0A9N9QXG9_9NEOP|nr:unnamed protein product [Diatraea saccharalis]
MVHVYFILIDWSRSGGSPLARARSQPRDPRLLRGAGEYVACVRERVPPAASAALLHARIDGGATELHFKPLLPGAVRGGSVGHGNRSNVLLLFPAKRDPRAQVAFRIAPTPRQRDAVAALGALVRRAHSPREADPLRLRDALADLDLVDLNAVLYRCDAEEREATGGDGVYHVPGHGPLPYAGLQGVASLLAEPSAQRLDHPLCRNLRDGDWLLDYHARRLEREPRLRALGARVRELARPLADLPRYLAPAYAGALLAALHAAAERAALALLGGAARGGEFARALALTSVQLTAAVASAPLPAPAPALQPPPPRGSLSAGLPHFAVGYMRCWGRDTFVSLRGLYLLTGRPQEARAHILGYAACVRHGLVPNLLDGGGRARFNCRDAVWWWLYTIQQYCAEVEGGEALLAEPVARLFPQDDAPPAPPGAAPQPLYDVMQETLDVHFQGLVFRERNAGRQIDAHMSDKGFEVQIGIDPETGFPFGGNDANCGTWMDKMGSSEKAGTRGTPATPRDGSAVELVALAYSTARWLHAQHRARRYPHAGLVRRHRDGRLTSWPFAAWAERIRRHFERAFWVPPAPSAADARPDLVHRRAIYKDTHGASRPWADYQLRCNFPVAMAVAPDLFDPKRAWLALDNVERLLLGPLGVKTLDPADWAYRGTYDNADDSADPAVAHGFNYHQGPEWVWPLGFYLRARLAFAHENGRHARTVAAAYATLGPLLAEIRSSPWRGLPELTNEGGAFCEHSCRTQAWSSAAALEALHDLALARRARPLPAD